MYFLVDPRDSVNAGYKASFEREGISSFALMPEEFLGWLRAASRSDLEAVQGFLLGDFEERAKCASVIRKQSRAPIIALADLRSLEQTVELLEAGIDDVLPKPGSCPSMRWKFGVELERPSVRRPEVELL